MSRRSRRSLAGLFRRKIGPQEIDGAPHLGISISHHRNRSLERSRRQGNAARREVVCVPTILALTLAQAGVQVVERKGGEF
jgi:hypothetical protein